MTEEKIFLVKSNSNEKIQHKYYGCCFRDFAKAFPKSFVELTKEEIQYMKDGLGAFNGIYNRYNRRLGIFYNRIATYEIDRKLIKKLLKKLESLK